MDASLRELRKLLEAPVPTGSPEIAAPWDLPDDVPAV